MYTLHRFIIEDNKEKNAACILYIDVLLKVTNLIITPVLFDIN